MENQSNERACATCVPFTQIDSEEIINPGLSDRAGKMTLSGFWQSYRQGEDLKVVVPGVLLMVLSFFLPRLGLSAETLKWVQLALLPLVGWPVFRGAFFNIFRERSLSMNVLMSAAAIGAIWIGEAPEALVLLVLFNLSEGLETYTNAHARLVLAEFADLAPKTALLVSGTLETTIPVEQLQLGDEIIVKAGERFPMDGLVLEGQSDVDQSALTGESRLIPVTPGDGVLSGSINGQGLLRVRITRLAQDATIQRIIHLVTEAQSSRSPRQKKIDRFAAVYTPIILGVALLVAVVPTLFFRQPLLNTPAGYGWLHRALSLLMIGCPCALVISTPITLISGLTRAAREGVVFKGGVFLEQLGQVRAMAFDKTGTLTLGRPMVCQVKAVDCQGTEDCERCDDLLALAGSLEQHSSHPLGLAVVEQAEEKGLLGRYSPAEGLVNLAGRGQQGYINGKLATIGSLPLFLAEHETPAALAAQTRAAENQGQTTMLVCDGERVRGFLAVEDEVRPESAAVLADLRGMGIHSVMLTGDNTGVATRVAGRIGLEEVHASLLPEEKMALLGQLRSKYGQVAMLGDGINDSPALVSADLGIAMGGAGNAQVLETADVVLMKDDLSRLPFAVRLSRFTNHLVQQNIQISLGVKFLVGVLALLGLTPLWVAVLGDIGISLGVTLNGLRAGRFEQVPSPSLVKHEGKVPVPG